MTTPLSATAPANSPEEAAFALFNAATSLEQQFAVLATLMQRKETDYNRANPTESPKNRITISPDYEVGQLNMTVDLLMSGDAVGKTLVDAITSALLLGTWQRLVWAGISVKCCQKRNVLGIRRTISQNAPILLLPSYMSMDSHYRQAIAVVEQAEQLIEQPTSPADLELGQEKVKQAQQHLDALPIGFLNDWSGAIRC